MYMSVTIVVLRPTKQLIDAGLGPFLFITLHL